VRIYLKEVQELVKLNQLSGDGFCRIDFFLVEDDILVSFQLVTVCYLALGNLGPLFAEKPVGNKVYCTSDAAFES
jgi:hypothetical protein